MRKFLIVSLVLLTACVSAEDKRLIQSASAVGQGNLREWETLTAEEKKTDHYKLVRACAVLDHNINGAEIPAGYESATPPWEAGQ